MSGTKIANLHEHRALTNYVRERLDARAHDFIIELRRHSAIEPTDVDCDVVVARSPRWRHDDAHVRIEDDIRAAAIDETELERGAALSAAHRLLRYMGEPPPPKPTDAVPSVRKTITVQDLVDRANEAVQKMSLTNPNRWLMLQLASSTAELAARCGALEAELGITAQHIVDPPADAPTH